MDYKAKIRRLERKVERLEAECELYQMMCHDIAAPHIIATIKAKYPAIAKALERKQ